MEVSFNGAIKINSDTSRRFRYCDSVDCYTKAVINTVKGQNKNHGPYNDGQTEKISTFLHSNMTDYDEASKFCLAKVNEDVYLFTGQDAIRASQIISDKTNAATKLRHTTSRSLRIYKDKAKQIENEYADRLKNLVRRIKRNSGHLRTFDITTDEKGLATKISCTDTIEETGQTINRGSVVL